MKFRHHFPLTVEYMKDHGWEFMGSRSNKTFILQKGGFKYHTSMSPSDGNADKQVRRELQRYDRTGAINGNPADKAQS